MYGCIWLKEYIYIYILYIFTVSNNLLKLTCTYIWSTWYAILGGGGGVSGLPNFHFPHFVPLNFNFPHFVPPYCLVEHYFKSLLILYSRILTCTTNLGSSWRKPFSDPDMFSPSLDLLPLTSQISRYTLTWQIFNKIICFSQTNERIWSDLCFWFVCVSYI